MVLILETIWLTQLCTPNTQTSPLTSGHSFSQSKAPLIHRSCSFFASAAAVASTLVLVWVWPPHHGLSTPPSGALWPLEPETSASAPAPSVHDLVTRASPRGNTDPVCVLGAPCADADVSLHCAFSLRSHPLHLGIIGGKNQLTKQLSEESFSPADSCFLSLLPCGDNSVNGL